MALLILLYSQLEMKSMKDGTITPLKMVINSNTDTTDSMAPPIELATLVKSLSEVLKLLLITILIIVVQLLLIYMEKVLLVFLEVFNTLLLLLHF